MKVAKPDGWNGCHEKELSRSGLITALNLAAVCKIHGDGVPGGNIIAELKQQGWILTASNSGGAGPTADCYGRIIQVRRIDRCAAELNFLNHLAWVSSIIPIGHDCTDGYITTCGIRYVH